MGSGTVRVTQSWSRVVRVCVPELIKGAVRVCDPELIKGAVRIGEPELVKDSQSQ